MDTINKDKDKGEKIDEKYTIFQFNIDTSKILYEETIGSGSFGKIHPYDRNADDAEWVVKKVIGNSLDDTMKKIKEVILGFGCDHSSVLSVKGFALEKQDFSGEFINWCIHMKIPRLRETLKDRMDRFKAKQERFEEKEIISYFYDLTLGLEYLHKKRIAHNDFKLNNILFDHNDKIKIADLGMAEYDENESFQEESDLKRQNILRKDIWSLGKVIAGLYLMKDLSRDSDVFKKHREALGKSITYPVILDLLKSLLDDEAEKIQTPGQIKNILESNYPDLRPPREKESQNQEEENLDQIEIGKYKIRNEMSVQELESKMNKLENDFGYYFNFTRQAKRGVKIDINNNQKKNDKKFINDLMKKIMEFQHDNSIEKLRDFAHDYLQFSQNTDEMVKKLSRKIEIHFKELKQLSIDFSGCNQIKDQTIVNLISDIGTNIRNLQHLSVNFSLCKQLTEASVEGVTNKIISKLNKIKNLCLDFSWNKISTEAAKNLVKTVGENLKELDSLSLNLSSCNEISEELIQSIIQYIGRKPLKYLSINFSWNKNINNKTIKDMTNQIQINFKDLQNLSLEFCCCSKITEEAVKESIKQLSLLDKLTQLYLDFSNCEKISETVIQELKGLDKDFQKLKNLEEFSLMLSSKTINQQVREELADLLRGMLSSCKTIKTS